MLQDYGKENHTNTSLVSMSKKHESVVTDMLKTNSNMSGRTEQINTETLITEGEVLLGVS